MSRMGWWRLRRGRRMRRRLWSLRSGLRKVKGIVLCQCAGGMSRAPAAALICLAVWRGEGTEKESVEEVRRLRRGAVPHVGLVGLADEVLGRGGRLVEAVRTASKSR